MSSSFREIIWRYIMMKIGSGEWKKYEKIPSEKELSEKFNCSRSTIRYSLKPLIYSGFLSVKNGSGYYVNNTKIRENTIGKASFLSNDMAMKICDILNHNYNNHDIYIMKKFYDMSHTLMWVQFSILNKYLLYQVDIKELSSGISKTFAKKGHAINDRKLTLRFSNISFLRTYAKKLEWHSNDILYEFISSNTANEWAEKSIRLRRKSSFEIKYTEFEWR